nr:MAG TPA: hypothetical protein [Caudoviricetes sp.]
MNFSIVKLRADYLTSIFNMETSTSDMLISYFPLRNSR